METKYYCTKCGLIVKSIPDKCSSCNANFIKFRIYEPFIIKGLTKELNRISKCDFVR